MPYVIGIDLGTTNSALAYVALPTGDPATDAPAANMFAVPQLVNPSEVAEETLLPSFLYVPGEKDFPAGATARLARPPRRSAR